MKRYEKFVLGAKNGITFEISEGKSKRYEKFVLEAENDGISFEISEGISGELIIRAHNIATVNIYSKNYVNPPIPRGYEHVWGTVNSGFVIERCFDGSQFVWIPVGCLDSNGTLDGENFSEKFGRRNYYKDVEFSYDEFHEALNGELLEQLESVKKYGGFYISRYNISIRAGKPQSVKGVYPLRGIDYYEAKKIASTIEDNEEVKSHLTFGAEYDSILEWFIKTEVKTRAEITEDSTEWGNYCNTECSPKALDKTGSRVKFYVNNICDFAGNVAEWTQEEKGTGFRVARGGTYGCYGYSDPVATRIDSHPLFVVHNFGLRATLCIK